MNLEIENLLSITHRQEWRDWLAANCNTEKFCWIRVSGKPIANTLLYLDAVEEALCFGWIDSTGKSGMRRFSPRSKKSCWTELNKERVRRLEKLGLMTNEGRKCVPVEHFVISPEVMNALEKDKEVYTNFMSFPELYRRVRIDTIQSRLKRNETEVFKKRLNKFIENTKAGKMFGAWNDEGRLRD